MFRPSYLVNRPDLWSLDFGLFCLVEEISHYLKIGLVDTAGRQLVMNNQARFALYGPVGDPLERWRDQHAAIGKVEICGGKDESGNIIQCNKLHAL